MVRASKTKEVLALAEELSNTLISCGKSARKIARLKGIRREDDLKTLWVLACEQLHIGMFGRPYDKKPEPKKGRKPRDPAYLDYIK